MKNSQNIVVFKLSVLSTLLLCITVNSAASDIEIYRGAEASDGRGRVMLTLDNSTMMHQSPQSAGGGKPINEDFGSALCSSSVGSDVRTVTKTVSIGTNTYSYDAYYCDISKKTVDASKNESQINKTKIAESCELSSDGATYYCYDRFSMLKESLFNVIKDTRLGSGIAIGLSYFPPLRDSNGNEVIVQPLGLTDANRDVLIKTVAAVQPSKVNLGEKQAPVSKAYGGSAKVLIEPVVNQVDQCSGYGIYSLTAGTPTHDEMGVARVKMNSVLKDTSQILNNTAQCPDGGSGTSASSGASWNCVVTGARLFQNKQSLLSVPVFSSVVSFGTGFNFYDTDATALAPRDFPAFSTKPTPETIRLRAQQIISKNKNDEPLILDQQNAIIAGIEGKGGYFTANGKSDVVNSILDFIALITKVDIPYLITGAPTIPQDPLNPAIIQDKAYFPQFKPTPDENYQLWAGNLKKYRVNSNGRLLDKKDNYIFDSTGILVDNYDLWSPEINPDLALDALETVQGSVKFALMGGAKSQLKLRTSLLENGTQVVNRKLLTNRTAVVSGSTTTFGSGTSLKQVTLNYLTDTGYKDDPKRGYLMSLLGYDVDGVATTPSSIDATYLSTAKELRQLGAVMHSSPLLFSNEGKVAYNNLTNSLVTSNRKDFVMYGTTQGLIHIVDAETGKEKFTFAPNEMVDNQPSAFLSSTVAQGGLNNLFYGVDAPWTTHTEYVVKEDGTLTVGGGQNNTQGKQILYGGLRMGGQSYYALDVSDIDEPKLKFHINPSKVTSTTDPLYYMGQSWSKPKLAWVNWAGSRKLVMFVGGGYDSGYESDTYNQINAKGAGVYMFDAESGALLWWSSSNASTSLATTTTGVIGLNHPEMKYSVVSDIKTADRDNDGLVDHLYFGDLGGQVFRVDLNNNAKTIGEFSKRAIRILNLHQTNGTSPRFYAEPSFSTYKNAENGSLFAVISIASGNRSSPLKGYASGTSNRDYDAIYNIYDKDVARVDLDSATTLYTQDNAISSVAAIKTLNEITDNIRFSNTSIAAPYDTTAGWFYKFKGGTRLQDEKSYYSPAVIDYDLYVSTYDASKPGFSGPCGGGVQGESQVKLFCMPFGQCAADRGLTATNSIADLGAGIQNFAVGASDGLTRLLVGKDDPNSVIPNQRYGTKVKLISQRWYER
ncbi:pilus assembly protein [Acinetobacter junii]|uniref:pilus assembly protein n=1 Tax=Acinetobacter junii TaxID=40215 RepID=UPI003A8A0B7B